MKEEELVLQEIVFKDEHVEIVFTDDYQANPSFFQPGDIISPTQDKEYNFTVLDVKKTKTGFKNLVKLNKGFSIPLSYVKKGTYYIKLGNINSVEVEGGGQGMILLKLSEDMVKFIECFNNTPNNEYYGYFHYKKRPDGLYEDLGLTDKIKKLVNESNLKDNNT